MIFVLYGENDFSSRRFLVKLLEKIKTSPRKFEIKRFDFERREPEALLDFFHTGSIFGEAKAAVLENSFALPEKKKKILVEFLETHRKEFSRAKEKIIVFFEKREPSNKKEKKLLEEFKKEAKVKHFVIPKGRRLRELASGFFKQENMEISPEGLEALLEITGSDLWRLKNEADKLILAASGKKISRQDVLRLVEMSIEPKIFELIDRIGQKKKAQALKILCRHLKAGVPELYILAMISYQFRNIISVKDLLSKGETPASIRQKTGLHPFVVRKTFFQAGLFSRPQLKKIFRKIWEINKDLKSRQLPKGLLLEKFILEL